MIANSQQSYMSPQEYLEWEERQDIKYEYVNGEVFAKGIWELHPYEEGAQVHLTSVDFRFPISIVYEDVQLPM